MEEAEDTIRRLLEKNQQLQGQVDFLNLGTRPEGHADPEAAVASVLEFPLDDLEQIERDCGIDPARSPEEEFLRLNMSIAELLDRRRRTKERKSRLVYGARVVRALKEEFRQELGDQTENLRNVGVLHGEIRGVNSLAEQVRQGPQAAASAAQPVAPVANDEAAAADRLTQAMQRARANIAGA